MKRLLIGVLLCSAVSCAPDVGEKAARSLQLISDIRSGVMDLVVRIETSDASASTGLTLEGAFMLPEEQGALPEADLTYTQNQGDDSTTARFISNGEAMFVEVDGERTDLPPEQVETFRTTGDPEAASVFGTLDVSDWIPRPEIQEDGDLATITGELDVVAALNDIFEVGRRFGGVELPALEGDEAERVEAAVRASTAEITAGPDGLLRHLLVEIDLGVEEGDLRDALGPLAGAIFSVELSIDNVNEKIDVE